ncbi:MAG: MCE family protein [Chitinivibrionales bacterium]|nr:MCE family protein [Chitinivibrionales bacterium]
MSISVSQRARLGVFMTIAGVLITLFVAVPLGLRLADRQNDYYAYFENESISGLEVGATVKFRGVPIGKVTDIAYDPHDLSRVRVELQVDGDFPLKVDMYAQIGGMSITGIKHVELSGGTDESAVLEPDSEIETRPSVMTAITGRAEDIVVKIEVLLDHLNRMTHPDSSIGTILRNVAEISHDTRDFVAAVRPQIERGSHSFERVVAKVDSIAGDVQAITAEARRGFSAEHFGTIMSSIDSSAKSIRDVSTDVSLIIRQSREDIMVAMENLREALENANELTKILAENPSLLLRGDTQRERDLP